MKSYDGDIVGQNFTKIQVFEGVASILAGYNFLEKIDLDEKLSKMFIFRDDTNSIRQDIFRKFGVNITEEILFLTVRQLCDKIIETLPEIIPDKQVFSDNVVRLRRRLWTPRLVYNLVLCRLGRVVTRNIKKEETVQDLFDDVNVKNNDGKQKKLTRQLNHISTLFGINISRNMTLKEVIESAEFSLVQTGRMLSPNDPALSDDEKLWRFLISLVPLRAFVEDIGTIFPDAAPDRTQLSTTCCWEDLTQIVFGSVSQREKE